MLSNATTAIFAFIALVYAISMGKPVFAVVFCWLASPALMSFNAVVLERRRLRNLWDLRRASWAFLLGDSLFLPFSLAVAAVGWSNLDPNPLWGTASWTLAAAGLGIAAAFAFRVADAPRYTKLQQLSPTKLVHDMVAYPVLAGGLLFGAIPLLADSSTRWPYGWLILVGFALWAVAGFLDLVRKLQPDDMHIQFDWSALKPVAS